MKFGTFCEVYGKSLRNAVLEFILERDELDFAVSDILKELDISKPKLYDIVKELLKEGFIKRSRIVSGTQLYVLDKSSVKVKLLVKAFRECLKALKVVVKVKN